MSEIKKTDTPKTPKVHKRVKRGEIIRIEEIKKRLEENNIDDIDPEAVVSAYIPRRKGKIFGAALLRLDKMKLFLIGALALIAVLFTLAFVQDKMGNFTVNLDRLEMFRKGIAIADNASFMSPTARLLADSMPDAYDTTLSWLPDDLDETDGSHNGDDYLAYTYYVRNAGKEAVDYKATLTLRSRSKGAEEAVRVAVYENGERIIYAAPSSTGEPEEGCVSFESDKVVCSYVFKDFLVGYVNKYTIVIWMEGEDPECVDSIVGGAVEFEMTIAADNEDETSLFQKFIRDIWENLIGENPIGAGGIDSPDYYDWGEGLNWYTRRNKPENISPENV